MNNMYKGNVAGFVMPKMPDGSKWNGGDGSILCISGGHDANDMFDIINPGTYTRVQTVMILTAVKSICNKSDQPPSINNPNSWDTTTYDKWKWIDVDIWWCNAVYLKDSPQYWAETHFQGSCEWELGSGLYVDSLGNTFIDEDGNTVKKEMICSESPSESTSNVPGCPANGFTAKVCPKGDCSKVDGNTPTKHLNFYDNHTDGSGRLCQTTENQDPNPKNHCLEHPEKCVECTQQNSDDPNNLFCYCLHHPTDVKCKTNPGFCWANPDDPRCWDKNSYCKVHPEDQACKGPDPPSWWNWWIAWFMDHGFTTNYLEYMAVSEVPAIYLSVHFDTWKYAILDNAIAIAFPFVYYALCQWYNTYGPTNPWVQWAWGVFSEALHYWEHPEEFWNAYWYLIIPGVGIGGTYLFTLLNYQMDVPAFIDSELFSYGLIGTAITEFVFFIYMDAENMVDWILKEIKKIFGW